METHYRQIPIALSTHSGCASTIEVEGSKSYANRVLILAAVLKQKIVIDNIPQSSDVQTLIACLQKIGLDITTQNKKLSVANSFPQCENDGPPLILESKDGGTTNRFLAALLSRGKRKYGLRPSKEMKKRPMKGLLEALESWGAEVSESEDCIWIQGPGAPSTLEVDCKKTGQFASALALSYPEHLEKIIPINLSASKKYWEMTKEVIHKKDWHIPIDSSSLSVALAIGITLAPITLANSRWKNDRWPDSEIIPILQMATRKPLTSTIAPSLLKGDFIFDTLLYPDLIPTLIYLAICNHGICHFKNLSYLATKESNRYREIITILDLFGLNYTHDEAQSGLTIKGPQQSHQAPTYHPPSDHRMLMLAALLMKKFCGGFLSGTHHVNKSCPQFFDWINGST